MARKEAKARIKINKLLEDAGWRFFDDEHGKANIVLENHVKITQKLIDAFGEDFEKTKKGFIDYLLLDENGFPIIVLEAKSEDKSPLDGKEQARRYAQSQNVRFIILSNGNLHYFWDLERGNPNIITQLPRLESIKHTEKIKPNPKALIEEKVERDYIAVTQYPQYQLDPRWNDEATREDLIKEYGLKFLRPYQLRAIYALQDAVKKGNDRFLFEMATGTGKTLVSAGAIKLFFRSGNATRVLFLVDRLELEEQANKNFIRYLKNDLKTVIYKESRDDWRKAEIVVSTVQSLSFNNKYEKLFSPTDFDLIISDEAHRSIGGNSRAVFEYFTGYKLGLTATPKDYLKYLDPEKISETDPRNWERRQLLDTYITFGCASGEPTFRYSLVDGVKDGYLVNPIVVDARTEITTQLLSDKGYAVFVPTTEGDEEEQFYYHRDFEKKFFSNETNKAFCQTFMEHAIRDPLSAEIGKGLIFCVSQNHAEKITQALNEMADIMYPGKYNSDFAIQVTSRIPEAKLFTINFTNNNLNGLTKFLDAYKSCKTRVCVTVGMMTTGYDCEDILNLGLMRPIFSPTDFIQIKGRGTRTYKFIHEARENGKIEKFEVEKAKFKLFDFFANCEYFEEKFNYDQILELPKIYSQGGGDDGGGKVADEYRSWIIDPLKSFKEKQIGLEGMKIDRKLFERFERTVKDDSFIKENYEQGNMQLIEDYIRNHIFEKPEDYFNLDKLRKAIKLDRWLTLREIIDKIFGTIDYFKTKDELLEDEFKKFVSIYKPDHDAVIPIKNFLKAYIVDNEVRDIINKKEFSRFATNPYITIEDFKELKQWRTIIPEYVKDYVTLNAFI